MKTIRSGDRYYTLHDNGMISQNGTGPSNQWMVTGAVRLNNFGYEVERFTLAEVLRGGIEWRHKNGKQRVHIVDSDHGTTRVWMNPTHEVIG